MGYSRAASPSVLSELFTERPGTAGNPPFLARLSPIVAMPDEDWNRLLTVIQKQEKSKKWTLKEPDKRALTSLYQYENIDNTNRAVFSDIIVKPFGKQGGLMAVLAFNKPTHRLLLSEKS
jgi:hypothetical protein